MRETVIDAHDDEEEGDEEEGDEDEEDDEDDHDEEDEDDDVPEPPFPTAFPTVPSKTLHIAPMLNVSNREFRQLFRIMSRKCVLWTEMVVDETIAYSDHLEMWLGKDSNTHPIVCQIGGNNPDFCGSATQIVEQQYNYDEVNLNIDCPSDRVSGKREFGAVLMKRVETTLSVLQAMKRHTTRIPISVKCRVGIDECDDLDHVANFIRQLSPVCHRFYIHARKCVLGGLTPTQNRIVPPLNYPRVYTLCHLFPDCDFWINGGIPGLKAAKEIAYGTQMCGTIASGDDPVGDHGVPCSLCQASNGSCTAPPTVAPPNLRGCMIGRAAMDNPSMFWDVDRYFYGEDSNPCQNRRQVLVQYCEYLERTYPRRCCDDDERCTTRIPVPDFVVTTERQFCDICREMYGGIENETASSVIVQQHKTKISSRIVDRALKPIHGIFFGLQKNRSFRRACDELSRDTSIRNCGPGFILRKAMETMPAMILDQHFVKTEDLSDSDFQVHNAPRHN